MKCFQLVILFDSQVTIEVLHLHVVSLSCVCTPSILLGWCSARLQQLHMFPIICPVRMQAADTRIGQESRAQSKSGLIVLRLRKHAVLLPAF